MHFNSIPDDIPIPGNLTRNIRLRCEISLQLILIGFLQNQTQARHKSITICVSCWLALVVAGCRIQHKCALQIHTHTHGHVHVHSIFLTLPRCKVRFGCRTRALGAAHVSVTPSLVGLGVMSHTQITAHTSSRLIAC